MRMKQRILGVLSAVVLTLGVASVSTQGATADVTPHAVTLPVGIDLHDGTVQKFGNTYYAYGTQYGCGYQWRATPSTFCDFGVSHASSLDGPWSSPTPLFSKWDIDPVTGYSWNYTCAGAQSVGTSVGCFNPRMIQRSDGVFVLWFNAVAHRTSATTSAYVTMGCNGPEGGCGAAAGAPYGSTHIPTLHQCNGNNGDFSIIGDGDDRALVCNYGGWLSEEHLDQWMTNGNNVGTGSPGLAGGMHYVEGEGAFHDPVSGKWVMTFSDPQCGYCSGTPAGFVTSTSMMGPWTYPAATGINPPENGRRLFSPESCGGQPRTAFVVDGQPYEWYDIWSGQGNVRTQTNGGVVLDPLTVDIASYRAPDGTPAADVLKGARC